MTDLIDNVARAICNSVETDDYDTLPDNGVHKATYRQQAKAAIDAADFLRVYCEPPLTPTGEWLRILQRIVSENSLVVDWLFGHAKETAAPMEVLARAISEVEEVRRTAKPRVPPRPGNMRE